MRFTVATHILLLLAGAPERPGEGGAESATSFWLAARVHTNPVVVRRISGQLARAGLLRVRRGAGGAVLARPADAITLEDVWLAVNGNTERPLLARPTTNGDGADGARALAVLTGAFGEAEAAFRGGLRGITLRHLADRMGDG
ncbi:MAG TPA: Rrf2 family transcriptional regulator [Acetobacteraceae bacterium]|nr:Rrf2 family transcriptional regulator [Acetobacteraceae bacterium]